MTENSSIVEAAQTEEGKDAEVRRFLSFQSQFGTGGLQARLEFFEREPLRSIRSIGWEESLLYDFCGVGPGDPSNSENVDAF